MTLRYLALLALASSAHAQSDTTDPRAKLKPGLYDAGMAARAPDDARVLAMAHAYGRQSRRFVAGMASFLLLGASGIANQRDVLAVGGRWATS
jgi:hypothetical protein